MSEPRLFAARSPAARVWWRGQRNQDIRRAKPQRFVARARILADRIDTAGRERLDARIEDADELRERTTTRHRKRAVIGETTTALADQIHTNRSLRLVIVVVPLIALEIVINAQPLLNLFRR
ncbi:hypothetical protein SAMN05216360_108116 [Methylobacterium phyllostachyos]|uniref:Uncharacterized protein n=1 Tax=Methylobacterium phyllostachyos TaxID=582672 RepID=A0A1H0BBM8_9HYPH|nr:hypothetical protein [Methylobacterium phyllostachyos]SDN43074.1 hypothetical protein SAMN05216360_108116 [Methylobacterium phyllostachyos]